MRLGGGDGIYFLSMLALEVLVLEGAAGVVATAGAGVVDEGAAGVSLDEPPEPAESFLLSDLEPAGAALP